MVDRKLEKTENKLASIREENQQLRMSVFNIRQMYEASIGEKQALQAQHQQMQTMLTGLLAQARGKTATIKAKTFALIQEGNFAGIDTKLSGEDLVLTIITQEQMEEMIADIQEATDGGDPV